LEGVVISGGLVSDIAKPATRAVGALDILREPHSFIDFQDGIDINKIELVRELREFLDYARGANFERVKLAVGIVLEDSPSMLTPVQILANVGQWVIAINGFGSRNNQIFPSEAEDVEYGLE